MIVSWNWLKDYVDLNMDHDELVERLTMSGLNHEGSKQIGDDFAIDLEVTSNRPDCLGHLGVAREIAVLYQTELNIPTVELASSKDKIADSFKVELDCEDLCYRFTARLIRGVKVGPSPEWLVTRLQAVFPGYKSINNVADITNYVMMETGQPLHAFDYGKIKGGKIVVRSATKDEEFLAINHDRYRLDEGVCVIADSERPMAVGGVMGGADSEVSEQTVDILIEAAEFSPMSIRSTARQLNLHSPASHRFERPIDPTGTDYASQRCCQMILDLAGGELAGGIIDEGRSSFHAVEVTLRFRQLKRILGIEIPADVVPGILAALGCEIIKSDESVLTVIPPTWRRDLSRECDLIEEVGRIYGFDKIPETADVPMAATVKRNEDRVAIKIRSLMTAAGFDESMTASLVPEPWSVEFSPWTNQAPLVSSQPMLGVLEKASKDIGRVEFARRSLVPSLLESRRINEHRGGEEAELFEIAKVYLPNVDSLPSEPLKLSFVGSRDYYAMKGLVDALFVEMNPGTKLDYKLCEEKIMNRSRGSVVQLNGKTVGLVGEVSSYGQAKFQLRKACSVAELDVSALLMGAILVPQHEKISGQPPVTRDFNFVVDESLRWNDLSKSVSEAAGEIFESVEYVETFRNTAKDGPDKKRILLSVKFRSSSTTLTGEDADHACQSIIASCREKHDASLVS